MRTLLDFHVHVIYFICVETRSGKQSTEKMFFSQVCKFVHIFIQYGSDLSLGLTPLYVEMLSVAPPPLCSSSCQSSCVTHEFGHKKLVMIANNPID